MYDFRHCQSYSCRYAFVSWLGSILIGVLCTLSFFSFPNELDSTKSKRYELGTFHQSGFGGLQNIAHPAGERYHRKLQDKHVYIPQSAVKHAVPSLYKENILNLHGHYIHDEHQSPWASHLYSRPQNEIEEEQISYLEKMKAVRDKYGAWGFRDDEPVRPLANFTSIEYKDMKNEDFPPGAWQMDETYVRNLIKEAKSLIGRVREGVYAEYGWASEHLTEEQKVEREDKWAIHIAESNPMSGIGWINQAGFDMLVRKLLHAMITNDEFYYILGGHSAAAGHGNNFHQQYTMQFNHIMEPVFHKLGVRLISRNMAMGGLGTMHFSLASGTLYGEKDFLLWDSSMTEKSVEDQDLFNKQAILGGERVPIIFSSNPNNLDVETGGNLWYGSFHNWRNDDFVPMTEDLDQVETLPFAAQYVKCDSSVKELCSEKGNPNKYHDSCWVDRIDFQPKVQQSLHVGGQASWHPGDKWHQVQSRKQIMLFLKAFDVALDTWESGIKSVFPLPESYWHVGEKYKTVQSTLSNYLNMEGKGTTACEKKWKKLDLDKVCRQRIYGMTEWTPVNGVIHSIRQNLKASSNGYIPTVKEKAAYDGIDLLPLEWRIPNDEVDVHAIAIATTYERNDVENNAWVYKDTSEQEKDERHLQSTDSSNEDELTPSNNINPKDTDVIPGLGWDIVSSERLPTGFCDGSPMSTCSRQESSSCLLYGHNDARTVISGNGLSGWLVINLPKVRDGLIFARLEWWHPRGNGLLLTKNWKEVNDGHFRNLGKSIIPWPDDIMIDIAIDGKIVATKHKDFSEIDAMAYNQGIYPLLNDESLIDGDDPKALELGIRIRSETNPKDAALSISHIYYA